MHQVSIFFVFFFLGVAENDVGKLGKNNKRGSAAAAASGGGCVIHVSHGSLCSKGVMMMMDGGFIRPYTCRRDSLIDVDPWVGWGGVGSTQEPRPTTQENLKL